MEDRVPARLTREEGRKFAFPVGGACLVLAGIAYWRNHALSWRVLLGLGTSLIAAGAVIPVHLQPVARTWMGLGAALSKVTTPIFMGIVFFLVLSPIGLVMRMMGRQPMRRTEREGSFWVVRTDDGRSDLTRQF